MTVDAARFVGAFAEAWAGPHRERLLALLHPDVRLVQPIFGSTTGRETADAMFFQPLFRLLPDLRIAVTGWSAAGDVVFIEWAASATLGRRPLRWSGVDRFVLAEGRAVERVAYFDALPLVVAILRRPSVWLSFLRSGAGRSWRGMLAAPAPRSTPGPGLSSEHA
jgi:ketosteroid isomerase-like protein